MILRKPLTKATQEGVKDGNTRLVLQTIIDHQPLSRADVARITGLSRGSASEHVSTLIAEDLVIELGTGPSAGGKPPTLLAVNPGGRNIVAIDLSRRPFEGAIVDLSGEVVGRDQADSLGLTGAEALVAVQDLIEALVDRAERPILGVGIACPGLIRSGGVVELATNLGWRGTELGESLRNRLELPVVVGNDADAAALAESTDARDEDVTSLLVLRIGDGVGAGIILDGRLVRGQNHAAGELGHINIPGLTTRCRCGKTGCLETAVSTRAILRQSGLANSDTANMKSEEVVRALGRVAQEDVISAAGCAVGHVLGTLIAALDIQTVRIGGEILGLGPKFFESVRNQTEIATLPDLASDVSIDRGKTEPDSAIYGAFWLVIQSELGLVPWPPKRTVVRYRTMAVNQ
jgi:predicted NBD/HSP70 family sugar kinase